MQRHTLVFHLHEPTCAHPGQDGKQEKWPYQLHYQPQWLSSPQRKVLPQQQAQLCNISHDCVDYMLLVDDIFKFACMFYYVAFFHASTSSASTRQ